VLGQDLLEQAGQHLGIVAGERPRARDQRRQVLRRFGRQFVLPRRVAVSGAGAPGPDAPIMGVSSPGPGSAVLGQIRPTSSGRYRGTPTRRGAVALLVEGQQEKRRPGAVAGSDRARRLRHVVFSHIAPGGAVLQDPAWSLCRGREHTFGTANQFDIPQA
jgi:hypothetical protein